ncbi:MAG: PIN domain-containing protein [Chthoniobacterales bacterium]|nr:PIN domain-containing protein [Chthoniobacterales bacterium]
MKVLLDTDVLMDVALGRADFGPDSRALLAWCHQTPQASLIAWHTVSNLFYLLSAARSAAFARSFLEGLLHFATIVSGGTDAVRNALAMRMSDFEDALQVAAAVSGEAQFIITRNVRDYRASLIPALTPRSFLLRFVAE